MIATARALVHLARMVASTRFRLRGRYWAWRRETAEGNRGSITPTERWRATLEYGRWASRLSRLR